MVKKVRKIDSIPEESDVLNGFGSVDYVDTYAISVKTSLSAEEVSRELMSHAMPCWVRFLYRVRNLFVRVLGLEAVNRNEGAESVFTLIAQNEHEVIMGKDDTHLNFRGAILLDRESDTLSFITLVHFNNWRGRLYFLPVKPFHKLIVKSLLKKYLKRRCV